MIDGHWLSQLTPSPTLLILIVATIALLESLALIGLLIPGIALLTAAASLAGHQQISLMILLSAATIGAIIGDGLSFAFGHIQRDSIPGRWPFRAHPQWLARGARFFQRYGVLSVFIGRFVGPVRPVIPMIAGMLHMSPWAFASANIGSAILWAPAYLLPGYLFGRSWTHWMDLPAGSLQWLTLLSLVAALLAFAFSWLRHQLAREGHVYRGMVRLARRHGWLRRWWLGPRWSRPRREVPLASLCLLLTSMTALSAWTLLILEADTPLGMDEQVRILADGLRTPLTLHISEGLAYIGDRYGILALCIPWLVWLGWARHFSTLWHLSGALVTTALTNTVFKALVARARPDTPMHLADSLAYPSAHTSISVVVFGLAAAFVAQELPHRRRFLPYWLAILACLSMGLSRLLLDVHWLSDIVGGALLGLVICAVTRISHQRLTPPSLSQAPWVRLALSSAGLLIARLLWLPHA
ncbi:bifunctional DedA family/phosphatase PAP2 family protein [Aidingimonas lacisalsi]|uniref:bifunctional DedA family/phosphatase PAP2 family protein n=1 Tax=Aidingimonas lacisalsi TaxID=2604086 RepID=UPI0011D21A2E|nr:bifunctional DedA family/phosphatase PAP2 family protein [Aidingimonas lacisalsi]